MSVEIQTNAHQLSAQARMAIASADLIGLSIDGSTADAHDRVRSKPGNFALVLGLARELDATRQQFVVRTVVTRQNYRELAGVARLVSSFSSLLRWSLLQFSPIEEGFTNRDNYEISNDAFETAAEAASNAYTGHGEFDPVPNQQRVGAYLLLTSKGDVYGRFAHPPNGSQPIVGNILGDHLVEVAGRVPFDAERHSRRMPPLSRVGLP